MMKCTRVGFGDRKGIKLLVGQGLRNVTTSWVGRLWSSCLADLEFHSSTVSSSGARLIREYIRAVGPGVKWLRELNRTDSHSNWSIFFYCANKYKCKVPLMID